jgi:hypothetical protein
MNTHPEKWYIPLNDENQEELNAWWRKKAIAIGCLDGPNFSLRSGNLLLSKHPFDRSYYWGGSERDFAEQNPSYQKITLKQFREITNSTPIPMPKTIQISRQLLNEYYDAATTPQKEYLSEHFKLDGTTTDEAIRELHAMACDTWKPRIKRNHPDCFPEESKYFDFSEGESLMIVSNETADKLGIYAGFIQVRNNEANPETHKRSFYLSTRYNWELKHDGREDGNLVYVLIPTKKLS